MSPVEYRTILKYPLMIQLFSIDAICPVCRKSCLDSFGEHAVHCKELSEFIYRHDMVRDVLFDIYRRARISAKKEAPANFLTDPSDGRSTLRRTDFSVFGRVEWKHACVNLTRVSPLMGLSSRDFTVGQTALKTASCKVTKHEKTCIENQHVFIPFAFDTFCFLASERWSYSAEFNGLCTAICIHSATLLARLGVLAFALVLASGLASGFALASIADVFGSGYMSALQIADMHLFGFGSCCALVCMHLFGLLRIETSSITESALWDAAHCVCFSVFVYFMFGKLPMFTAAAL
ncbi:hypothetical protein Tco_0435080 [Tanacetum coccineum]